MIDKFFVPLQTTLSLFSFSQLQTKSAHSAVVVNFSDVKFDFGHATLQLYQLHVEGGLLTPERCHLLLETRIFILLVGIVALHFLFNFEVLVRQCLPNFLSLQSDHVLQSIFFLSQNCNLFFVNAQFISETSQVFLQYNKNTQG